MGRTMLISTKLPTGTCACTRGRAPPVAHSGAAAMINSSAGGLGFFFCPVKSSVIVSLQSVNVLQLMGVCDCRGASVQL